MSRLWTPIRCRLAQCLDSWDPCDRSALAILKPWQKVFDSHNWEVLMDKILVKLRDVVIALPVKPDGQELKPLQDVLCWVDTAPLPELAHLLDQSLLPRWTETLKDWLMVPGCKYDEVLAWYKGW